MTWASAAQAAEDAALRWVAAAEIAREPAPAQLVTAVGGAISQAATAALSAAVDTARVRVDLLRRLSSASTSGSTLERLREANRVLFTVEYRLAIANPSTAAAKSRLAEAKAARLGAAVKWQCQ